MRIIYLPNKIYKLYDYAKKHNIWHAYREKYGKLINDERVQVDHMTVTKNGRAFKHFQAWERKSKILVAQVYSRARSKDAAKFLKELVKKAPYKILSIQVDGGSEFMKEFEETCQELGIELFVLPPASPKYNGEVERAIAFLWKNFMRTLNFWLILSVPYGTNYKKC